MLNGPCGTAALRRASKICDFGPGMDVFSEIVVIDVTNLATVTGECTSFLASVRFGCSTFVVLEHRRQQDDLRMGGGKIGENQPDAVTVGGEFVSQGLQIIHFVPM